MQIHPALSNSPTIEEDVRNLDFSVKFPDFYPLAVNSKSYKTNSVGAKENMPVCARLGPGPLLAHFGLENLNLTFSAMALIPATH